jgi:hypothetical protein
MRCAEKTPMDILPAIEVDLHAYVAFVLSKSTSLTLDSTALMTLPDWKL